MSADHAPVGLLGSSVLKIIASQSHFSCPQVVFLFRLNHSRCSDVILGKRGIPAKQEALLIRQQ
jgi:hypothetical protein